MDKVKDIIDIIKNKKIFIYVIIIVILIIIIVILYIYNKKIEIIDEKLYTHKLNKIYVHITGEVRYEGYYEFNIGTTLEQAINLIGGITKEADIKNLALKKVLVNNENIKIPSKYTKEEVINFDNELIDINIATKQELTKIEGIGESTADKIIEYREKNKFSDIEDLLEVDGIGEKKLDSIREYIIVN